MYAKILDKLVGQHHRHDKHQDVFGAIFLLADGEDDASAAGMRHLDEYLLGIDVGDHLAEELGIEADFHRLALIFAGEFLAGVVRELKVFGTNNQLAGLDRKAYLMGGLVGFATLGWSAALVGSVVIYPYLLLNFLFSVMEKPEQPVAEDELVRFYDSAQQLKLVVAASAVVYIEASTNYVIIKYTEGERVKDFQLRNSMKTLEPQLLKHGIIRCQRSYFVNPKHVTALRKDKEGVIIAELDVPGVRNIPVSPNYYDNLSKLL